MGKSTILPKIHSELCSCPEPILSNAGVVQRIRDFVVVNRLPRVALEDSVLCVSRIVHLASTLLLLLSLPKRLADFQELDLLRERNEMTAPFLSLGTSRVCFMFELPNMHLQVKKVVCFMISCQSIDKVLPRCLFILTSGSNNFLLVDGVERVEPFRADHSELLVLVL